MGKSQLTEDELMARKLQAELNSPTPRSRRTVTRFAEETAPKKEEPAPSRSKSNTPAKVKDTPAKKRKGPPREEVVEKRQKKKKPPQEDADDGDSLLEDIVTDDVDETSDEDGSEEEEEEAPAKRRGRKAAVKAPKKVTPKKPDPPQKKKAAAAKQKKTPTVTRKRSSRIDDVMAQPRRAEPTMDDLFPDAEAKEYLDGLNELEREAEIYKRTEEYKNETLLQQAKAEREKGAARRQMREGRRRRESEREAFEQEVEDEDDDGEDDEEHEKMIEDDEDGGKAGRTRSGRRAAAGASRRVKAVAEETDSESDGEEFEEEKEPAKGRLSRGGRGGKGIAPDSDEEEEEEKMEMEIEEEEEQRDEPMQSVAVTTGGMEKKEEEHYLTLDVMRKATLLRRKLEETVKAPYFEALAKGAFVRVIIGQRDRTTYEVAMVDGVQTLDRRYKIEVKDTNKALLLRVGLKTHVFSMDKISNEPITAAECQGFIEKVRAKDPHLSSLPSLEKLNEKKLQISLGDRYSDFAALAKEEGQHQNEKVARPYVVRKGEIDADLERAKSENDLDAIERLQKEMDELVEDEARKVQARHIGSAHKLKMINQKNAQLTSQNLREREREKRRLRYQPLSAKSIVQEKMTAQQLHSFEMELDKVDLEQYWQKKEEEKKREGLRAPPQRLDLWVAEGEGRERAGEEGAMSEGGQVMTLAQYLQRFG